MSKIHKLLLESLHLGSNDMEIGWNRGRVTLYFATICNELMSTDARVLSSHPGKNLIPAFPPLPRISIRVLMDGCGERGCHEEWAALRVWLPSTVREQLSQQDAAAAAGSKQAETADSVNHSFTPSKRWRTRQRAGESLSRYFHSFSSDTIDCFHTISALDWGNLSCH